MKKEFTKKCGVIIACSALMAAALAGGVAGVSGITAKAVEGDTPASTPKVFYYVDAGNVVTEQGGTTAAAQGAKGYGSAVRNNFMIAHGLQFGDANGNGLYNSLTDWEFYKDTDSRFDKTQVTPDPTTKKEWGAYIEGDNKQYSWDTWRHGTTGSTVPGYDTMRYVNENNGLEGATGLIYKFQVDDATTELTVSIGTRGSTTSWIDQNAPDAVVNINGAVVDPDADEPVLKQESIPAKNDEEIQYDFSAYGVAENGKYYVTLTFGGNSKLAYINWIMIATADYELPIGYTFPTYVEANATTVTATPSDGSDDVTATITEESQAALAAADLFSEVDITVNVGEGKTANGRVTVLPANTKYFVNVGGAGNGLMLADGEYNATNGYGYIQEGNVPHSGQHYPGSAQWVNDPFNISCRVDMDTLVYQFDAADGKVYEVIVGIVEHWAQYPITGGRKAEISVNGGAGTLLTLPIANDASVHGSVYGYPAEGKLNVKIETKCPEATVIAYILVAEHAHGTMTKTDATASTCEQQGTIEYYSCAVCGLKYNDENATTLITDTTAPLLAHSGTKTDAVTATCEHPGNIAYWTCENGCGKKYADNDGAIGTTELTDEEIAIAQLAHSGTKTDAQAATCTAPGNVAYWTCGNGCGKKYADNDGAIGTTELTDEEITIAATGHSAGDDVVWGTWTDEFTCTYSGTCSVCSETLSAAAATITSAVTTEPTCTEKGVRTYTAKAGDKVNPTTKTEEIDALGHDYENITWNWDGYACTTATVACKNDATHTDTLTVTVTSEVTTEATTEADGVKTYTATATVGDKTYTDTKTEKIDKLTGNENPNVKPNENPNVKPDNNEKGDEDKGLSAGAIAGIVIGVVVAAGAAAGAGVFFFKRKLKK